MRYSEVTSTKSVFTQILDGEISGVILFTTERFFAILTNKASQTGHTLLIPKLIGVQYEDFPTDYINEYGLIRQFLTRALHSTYQVSEGNLKIGTLVSGFEIRNHWHEHYIPSTLGIQVSIQSVTPVSMDDRILEGNKIRNTMRVILSQFPDIGIIIKDNQ